MRRRCIITRIIRDDDDVMWVDRAVFYFLRPTGTMVRRVLLHRIAVVPVFYPFQRVGLGVTSDDEHVVDGHGMSRIVAAAARGRVLTPNRIPRFLGGRL